MCHATQRVLRLDFGSDEISPCAMLCHGDESANDAFAVYEVLLMLFRNRRSRGAPATLQRRRRGVEPPSMDSNKPRMTWRPIWLPAARIALFANASTASPTGESSFFAFGAEAFGEGELGADDRG